MLDGLGIQHLHGVGGLGDQHVGGLGRDGDGRPGLGLGSGLLGGIRVRRQERGSQSQKKGRSGSAHRMPPRMEPGDGRTYRKARPPAPTAGLGSTGPVSGLARDGHLSMPPEAFPRSRLSGSGEVSRSEQPCVDRCAYRCGAAQESHLLPMHPARYVTSRVTWGESVGKDTHSAWLRRDSRRNCQSVPWGPLYHSPPGVPCACPA